MKLYKVYAKKSEKGEINDIVVFKEGFSLIALFFNLVWLLYNKLWLKFTQCFLILFIAGNLPNTHFEVFINVVVILSIAFYGHDWYSEKLVKRKGYVFEGYEFVKNKDEALLKFISCNKGVISYPKINGFSYNFFEGLRRISRMFRFRTADSRIVE